MKKAIKYKCTEDFIGYERELFFEKGKIYFFKEVENGFYRTEKNNLGFEHVLSIKEIIDYFKLVDESEPTTQITNSTDPNRLKYIDAALRLANIQLHSEILEKVVKIVDLVNEKGGKVSVEDIVKL